MPASAMPATHDGVITLFFTERAYWLYLTGHRLGDLRRLVRDYRSPHGERLPDGQPHPAALRHVRHEHVAPCPVRREEQSEIHGLLGQRHRQAVSRLGIDTRRAAEIRGPFCSINFRAARDNRGDSRARELAWNRHERLVSQARTPPTGADLVSWEHRHSSSTILRSSGGAVIPYSINMWMTHCGKRVSLAIERTDFRR